MPWAASSISTSGATTPAASSSRCTSVSEPSASASATAQLERRAAARRVARVVERLGPDPDDHVLARARVQRRPRRPAARSRCAPSQHGEPVVARLEPAAHEVHRRRADERRHEQVRGPVVERLRRVDLLQPPVAHDRDAVAHRHRLDLVVRDVEHRRAQLLVQPRDVGAHLDAQLGVEVGERLVHQERLRGRARSRGRARRAGAARPRARAAGGAAARRSRAGRRRRPRARGSRASPPPPSCSAKPMFVLDAHVRVERVALEDHRDVAVARRDVGHVARRRSGSCRA